jgi:ABC-type branched-subunit amino acid transport system substrate-binding protein
LAGNTYFCLERLNERCYESNLESSSQFKAGLPKKSKEGAMKRWQFVGIMTALALLLTAVVSVAEEPIKIARVVGITGPLEAYAKQSLEGFTMGLDYATKGTNKILGRPVELIVKDTQLKPDMGKQLLTEAYKDDKVDLAVGGVSSAEALAMLPVAEEFKKILIVEPAVADSITGKDSSSRPLLIALQVRIGIGTYFGPVATHRKTRSLTLW